MVSGCKCYCYVETKRSLIDVDGDDVGVVVKFDKALDKRLNLYNYIKVRDGVGNHEIFRQRNFAKVLRNEPVWR